MRGVRICFAEIVQRSIERAFDAAYSKLHEKGKKALPPSAALVMKERTAFVRAIARCAELGKSLEQLEQNLGSEKERKRKMTSLGNAAAKVADSLNDIDDAAMIDLAARVVKRNTGEELGPPDNFVKMVRQKRPELVFVMAEFSAAALDSARSLPTSRTNPALTTATSIERAFFEYGFEFSGSFATVCLEAAFGAAGLNQKSLDYFITKGKKGEGSMSSLIRKLNENGTQK